MVPRRTTVILRVALVAGAATLPAAPAGAQTFWLPGPEDSLVARARADSNDPVAHHLVALARLNRRKFDQAEQALREALAVDPRYAPAHFGLAVLTLERHADEFAPPWLRRRRRLSPAQLDSVLHRVSASVRTAVLLDPLVELTAPGAPADTGLPRAAAASRGEDARFELARAWARQGRFEPGVALLEGLVARSLRQEESDSAHPLTYLLTNDFRYLDAYWRERAGRFWAAEQGYRQVLAFDLGFWMAHVRLASLYERAGRLDEALAERRQAVFLNAGDPMLLVDLAQTLGLAGQLAAADSAFAQAMERLPRHPMIPYHRGRIAWLRGDTAGVRAGFGRFLALAPSGMAREIEDARLALTAIH